MPYIRGQENWPHFHWQSGQLINSLSKARFFQGRLLSKVSSLGLERKTMEFLISVINKEFDEDHFSF